MVDSSSQIPLIDWVEDSVSRNTKKKNGDLKPITVRLSDFDRNRLNVVVEHLGVSQQDVLLRCVQDGLSEIIGVLIELSVDERSDLEALK